MISAAAASVVIAGKPFRLSSPILGRGLTLARRKSEGQGKGVS